MDGCVAVVVAEAGAVVVAVGEAVAEAMAVAEAVILVPKVSVSHEAG